MGFLVLNGDRIVLNGDTVSLGGPSAAEATAAGTIAFAGQGIAKALASGQAAGTLPLGGSALGEVGPLVSTGAAAGQLPLGGAATGTARARAEALGLIIFDGAATATAPEPIVPPYDWAPPLDLAASAIVAQAVRFMQLAPVDRHDPQSELLPALAEAYDSALDDCLSACDWSFASVLATLPAVQAVDLTAEIDLPGTARLPGDLIRLHRVHAPVAKWRIDGRYLRLDQPGPVTIRYTARVTREEVFPAGFRTAVAYFIALQLGLRWSGGAIDPDALAQAAEVTLRHAMRGDSRQASAAAFYDAEPGLIDGGSGDWAMEAVA